MSNSDSTKKFYSGAFFLAGIILILFVVFVIGKDKGLIQRKFQVAVVFRNVGGLVEGAPVRLSGVNVGSVADISFLKEEFAGRGVEVRLNIFNKYRNQLSRNVDFAIKTEGILGEKLVEITVRDRGAKTDFNAPVIGQDPLNVQDLAEVFADAAEAFTRTSEDFNKVDIQELSKILAETAQSLSMTSKGVNTILTQMQYISIKSKRLLDRVEQQVIDGDLFKVF